MPRLLGVSVLLLSALLMGACDLLSDGDPRVEVGEPGVYVGTYSQGIEDSVFEPCGLDERWKIVAFDADTTFGRRIWERVEEGENPMLVRLRGTPTERGTFEGFFVTFDREFTLQEALDVQPLQGSNC
jgi:hypothetical protein